MSCATITHNEAVSRIPENNGANDIKQEGVSTGRALHIIQVFKDNRLYDNVKKCNLRLVKLLLDHGADASHKRDNGESPLFAALLIEKDECYDLCKLLLEKNADCNSRIYDTTPFLRALSCQSLKVVRLLLDHGADITVVDRIGRTALHYAAMNLRVDVLDFVLDQGIYVECGDNQDLSALFWAAEYDNYEGCELLLRRGAMVNRRSMKTEWTPLTWVIWPKIVPYNGQEARIVQLMLEYGADVIVRSLRIGALSGGSGEVRNILMRHMARLECLGSSCIHEGHRQIIENEDCYRGYYRTCLQELKNMKVTKFHNNVSVFSILMDSEKMLFAYARNENLVRALEKNNYDNTFPIYFPLLKKRFYAEVKKHRLRKNAATILSNVFMFNDPSHLVNQKILHYLTDEDLKILCL